MTYKQKKCAETVVGSWRTFSVYCFYQYNGLANLVELLDDREDEEG